MSYKILEKNGVDNENVDGGAFNNFAAGGRDGIVGGVLSECALTVAGSAIGISPGLIILHGIRIKVVGLETLALSSVPLKPTSYQVVAQATLASNGDVDFSFFIRTPQPLVQDPLYQDNVGVYQAELASFTHNPDGTISNLTKTLDIIYGSGGGNVNIEVGTVTTETLDAGLDADFDVNIRNEEGTNKILLDFDAKIPRGASGVDEGAVHFNEAQTLTESQKKQARDNTGTTGELEKKADKDGTFPNMTAGKVSHALTIAVNGQETIFTGETDESVEITIPDIPESSVTSVNGKTGDVTLSKTDVGLANVPNVDTQNASNINKGLLAWTRIASGLIQAGAGIQVSRSTSGVYTISATGGSGGGSNDNRNDYY